MAPRVIFDPVTYDVSNMIITDPEEKETPKAKYFNFDIRSKTPDGKEVPLIFAFEECASYGPKKWVDDSGQISWTMDIKLEGRPEYIDAINRISEKVKAVMIEKRKKFKSGTLEYSDLKAFSVGKIPKTDEGELQVDKMCLRPKLKVMKYDKEKNLLPEPKVYTRFFSADEVDEDGEAAVLDPEAISGKRCTVLCFVRIDSIFVNSVPIRTVKCVLEEVHVKLDEGSAPKNLMQVYKAMKNLDIAPPASSVTTVDPLKEVFDENEEETKESSEEEPEPEPTPAPAKGRGRGKK